MKSKAITIISGKESLTLEADLNQIRVEALGVVEKNAKHFAAKALPKVTGDKLSNYTDSFKTFCENKYAKYCTLFNPASNFPAAKIDHELYKENEAELDDEIKQKKNQSLNERLELGNYDPQSIPQRIRLAVFITIFILCGEILYNIKAFQATGENMLFALAISCCVSVGVFIAAHGAPMLYKEMKTALRRRLVVISTLTLTTVVFIALANLRSNYYAQRDFYINPIYFVVVNLFLFLVSAVLSYFIVPSIMELKQNSLQLRKYHQIQKLENEIAGLKAQRRNLKEDHASGTQSRIETVFTGNYIADFFRKLYAESVALFKSTNIASRADGCTPSCFNDLIPDLDIQDTTIQQFTSNRKIS